MGSERTEAEAINRLRSPIMVLVGLLVVVSVVALTPASDLDPSEHVVVSFPAVRSGPVDGVEADLRTERFETTSQPTETVPVTAGSESETAGEQGAADREAAPDDPPTPYEALRASEGVVYATDFTSLDDRWQLYHSPGHDGRGLRRPSAITIEPDPSAQGGSVMRITARMGSGDEAGELVSGGMALDQAQTFGTYTFRLRVGPDPDEGTSGVAILWPASNRWPEDGELDIVETWVNRSTRTPVETNIHSLALDAEAPFDAADDRLLTVRHEELDGTRWHTYRFEWRAERLTLAIDGGEPRVLTIDPTRIPTWDMVQTFQLDAFPTPAAPNSDPVLSGEVVLEVDWLVVER